MSYQIQLRSSHEAVPISQNYSALLDHAKQCQQTIDETPQIDFAECRSQCGESIRELSTLISLLSQSASEINYTAAEHLKNIQEVIQVVEAVRDNIDKKMALITSPGNKSVDSQAKIKAVFEGLRRAYKGIDQKMATTMSLFGKASQLAANNYSENLLKQAEEEFALGISNPLTLTRVFLLLITGLRKKGHQISPETVRILKLIEDKQPVLRSGGQVKLIKDILHFHFEQIHKKSLDQPDLGYAIGFPQHLLRAIQRTFVEINLAGLQNMVDTQAGTYATELLDQLEGLQLDEQDLPPGEKNIAHYLFGILYSDYKKDLDAYYRAMCIPMPSEISPDHPAYNGDFGRKIFRDEAPNEDLIKVPPIYKRPAIQRAAKELKKLWTDASKGLESE